MSKSTFLDTLKTYLKNFGSYFDLTPELVSQADAETEIRGGVSFKGSQLIVLIIAILIASLGLNTNSVPVIIGAMLISPLMGPIIGMGLALGIQDYNLLHRGLKNIAMAVLGSVLASAIYFLISPQYESSSQLLARTSPSIYDVLIGFFGGAAGILSIMCKNKGQVMPGVAIATSLMPPLCTAGYGLATMQMNFFFGALYLFFTNLVFIMFATWIAVKIMRYKKVVYQNTARYKRIHFIVYSVVFITIGVSAFLTYQMIRKNIFLTSASSFVDKEMVFPNTQVLSHKEYMKDGKRYIDVTLIGEYLPKDSLQLAMVNKLDSVGLGGAILNIKQGFSVGKMEIGADADFDNMYSVMESQIVTEQHISDSLRQVIKGDRQYSEGSRMLVPEVKILFPAVEDIALSRMTVSNAETNVTDTVHMVFVKSAAPLSVSDRNKLSEYVGVRLNVQRPYLMVNPADFPWPKRAEGNE